MMGPPYKPIHSLSWITNTNLLHFFDHIHPFIDFSIVLDDYLVTLLSIHQLLSPVSIHPFYPWMSASMSFIHSYRLIYYIARLDMLSNNVDKNLAEKHKNCKFLKFQTVCANYFYKHVDIFPDTLKVGRVVPVYKAVDREIAGNYRPISTLSFLTKVFEMSMYNRLSNFHTKFNIPSVN